MKKVVVITGSSSGLGLATTKHFIKKGWGVIGLSRTKHKLPSENFLHIITDIKDYSSVQKSFEIINDKYGKIDILINNASIFETKPFVDFYDFEIDNIIDTNLKGTIFCTLLALKYGLTHGRIINISSVSGTHGIENQSVYCATKYAINGFSESLNQELIKKKILITTICPGGIDTPLWNSTNQYPGNIKNLIKTKEIVKFIDMISELPENVVLKTMTLFPTNEWH